jgi:hypothetical protein
MRRVAGVVVLAAAAFACVARVDPVPSPTPSQSPAETTVSSASPTPTPSATPTRSPSPAEQALADAFVRFAVAPNAATLAGVPFAERVSLGLGEQLLVQRSREELARPDAWMLQVEHFRAHVGPFSALELLARPTQTVVVAGPHPHCASPPMSPPPQVAGSRQISIQPTGIDTCLLWYTVDLFFDPAGEVVAVTLDLWDP